MEIIADTRVVRSRPVVTVDPHRGKSVFVDTLGDKLNQCIRT
jgi:hypothetical protein